MNAKGDAQGSGRIVDPTLSFVDQRLARLAALWQARAQDGRLPERGDFGPEALHGLGLLPYVMLVDVVPGADESAARFRYRLVGTEITAVAERDVTGRFFDELYAPKTYRQRLESFGWMIRERRPLRTTDNLALKGKEFIAYEALSLPLANGGDAVAMIMIVMVPFAPSV